MDKNKTIALKQIDYKINKSCGVCSHGIFLGKSWGMCNKHTYNHQKHTDTVRQLSIHQSGHCNSFALGKIDLHGFAEFLDKGK